MPVIRSMSFITFIFCYQHSMPVIHSISWNHTKHETLNTHLIITLFIITNILCLSYIPYRHLTITFFCYIISNKRALAVNAQHLSGHEALPTVELVSCPLVLLYTSGVAMLRGLERWDELRDLRCYDAASSVHCGLFLYTASLCWPKQLNNVMRYTQEKAIGLVE